MENNAIVPQELIREAHQIQHSMRNPNPHFSINLPLLPIYLGEIFPLNPVNKVLPQLNIIKILNYV
jgi:hypothetical protein